MVVCDWFVVALLIYCVCVLGAGVPTIEQALDQYVREHRLEVVAQVIHSIIHLYNYLYTRAYLFIIFFCTLNHYCKQFNLNLVITPSGCM